MTISAISRINYTSKKEKSLKGLRFSDRNKTLISDAVSTGVSVDLDIEYLNNIPS